MDKVAKEKTRQTLSLSTEEAAQMVSGTLAAAPSPPYQFPSLFESFFLRGIKPDKILPGLIAISLKIPARLTDSSGKLSPGAIADLVDATGIFALVSYGLKPKATANISILYLSNAEIDEEIEVISRLLNHEGSHSNVSVSVRNITTGKLVANGQQSYVIVSRVKPEPKM